MSENRTNKKFKISFCTTCMNRLHHLRETLPKNIRDNESYGDVEFVLLNYNSKDDMDNWVKKEMKRYIDTGQLIYLSTPDPVYWNPSHAKNIATRYATGEILCNVDSDHFTERGYAFYVNESFNADDQIFLSGRAPGAKLDMMGRFCLWRSDFHKIRGYDEGFLGYGFEDQDIFDRLKLIGRKEKSIDFTYLKTISHHHADRVKRTTFMNDIKFILVSESSPETCALIIKNDNAYEHFVLITSGQMVSFDENRIETGKWEESDNQIILKPDNDERITLKTIEPGVEYVLKNISYRKMGDRTNIDALYYYSLLFNQRVYKRNIRNKQAIVNPRGFGEGIVFKNFDYEEPVSKSL